MFVLPALHNFLLIYLLILHVVPLPFTLFFATFVFLCADVLSIDGRRSSQSHHLSTWLSIPSATVTVQQAVVGK